MRLDAVVLYMSVVVIAATANCATITVAIPVYDNMISTLNNGRVNDPAFGIFLEHADNFTISHPSTVNRIDWSGGYKGSLASGDDDFTLRFYREGSSGFEVSPFAEFALSGVSRVATGQVLTTTPAYSYSSLFPDLQLAPGTYLVSIFNDPDINKNWLWAGRDSSPGNSFMRQAAGGAWSEIEGNGVAEFSFSLFHVVPEPSTLICGLTGLCLLATRRRAGSVQAGSVRA